MILHRETLSMFPSIDDCVMENIVHYARVVLYCCIPCYLSSSLGLYFSFSLRIYPC
jgi:hypothetical protein